MASRWKRTRWLFAFAPIALVACWSLVTAQGFNEREVKPQANIQDKESIWILEFRFKDPRLITVDIPGRGRRVVWYLWYQVINKTGKPRTFYPDFELVTLDKPGTYHDQVLPKAQEAIQKLEDPTGHLDIKNSVTIASDPIPLSKADAFPKTVTGVATWDDVNPDTSRFSIFVGGLSDGMATVDGPNNKEIIRRKTLQLNFKRVGDKMNQDSRDFRFVSSEWIYRAMDGKDVAAPAPEKQPER